MFEVKTALAGIGAMLVVAVAGVAQVPPGSGPGGWFLQSDGLTGVQARIQASDEEWKVIRLKIRAVMTARSAAEASLDISTLGSGMGMRGWGGFDFGAMMPTNDSFEGPGTVGARGMFGWGRFDPNMFAQFAQAFGRRGRGGFDPNGFGPDMAGFGGRGFGGMPGFGVTSPVTQALVDLRTVATDPNATDMQIREKTAVVRQARTKAKAELAAAEKALVQLLTEDQEAILVVLGYLD